MSLCLVGFRLLEIGLGDGAVGEEILRACIKSFTEGVGILGFDVGRAGRGVVRAGNREERLAGLHELAGRHEDFVDWSANRRENGGGCKCVVRHRARQAERARKRSFFRGHNLDVRHLFLRNAEEFGGVCLRFGGRERSHVGFGFTRPCAAPRDKNTERTCDGSDGHKAQQVHAFSCEMLHVTFLVPTAWRICSSASM